MSKNIQTDNAGINLVQQFLDYANIANASYALLHRIYENANGEKEAKADNLTFGDKLEQDIQVLDIDNKPTIKPKGTNTAYACAIEARFQKDKIIGKNYLFLDKAINNDITQVKPDSKLSQRTIDFVNRFRLLAHQENKERSREKGKE